MPQHASAFWPFSDARAAQSTAVPTATTPVLHASTNIDPNPNKGIGSNLQTTGDKALLAYTGPSGTIADVATSTPPDRISVYVVHEGDSLSDIATMFNVSVNTIIWANNLRNLNDIHPGTTLLILPVSGVEHTISRGDTLKSLAKKYGADADEIAQYNGLDADVPLTVGAQILIPGGELGTPVRASSVKSGGGTWSTKDPYLGGSGPLLPGYFTSPIIGGILTQGVHGWNAVDIGAPRGTPIHAAADGTAIVVRNNGAFNGGYGNYVVITHPNGTQTVYGHLKSAIVAQGQQVYANQVIGYVGMTGHTTGPHLHFEVRGATNPLMYCKLGALCSTQ